MIDLHMHSTASDGTDTPVEILTKVKEAGITIFSLTDHDTAEGVKEIMPLIPDDVTFIPGIEFTCLTEAGKCHILGYGFDMENPSFKALIEEGNNRRKTKLDKRIKFLKEEFGIEFTDEEMRELLSVKSAGKPHIANLLIRRGLAPDKNSAVKKYIDPCKTGTDRLDGTETVKTILEAGGVPVWAHPLGGTGEDPVLPDAFKEQLKVLKKAGLMGLECYYSKYGAEEIGFIQAYASAMNLLLSGGSDYHGKNKTVKLLELNKAGFPVGRERLTVLDKLLQ